MVPKLTRKGLLGIKTETEQNTAASLSADTDYIEAYEITPREVTEQLERDVMRPTIGVRPTVIGQRYGEVEFRVELKGSGVAGTPYAPLGAILKAAGLVETDEETEVSYKPTSTAPTDFHSPARSATVHAYRDGVLHKLKGALCSSFQIQTQAGQIAAINVTMQGILDGEPADESYPANLEFIDTQALVVGGGSFAFDSTNLIIENLEIDLGPQVALRPSIGADHSVYGFVHTGREPSGSMNPEAVAMATHNVWNKLRSGSEMVLAFVIGSTAGNIVEIGCPKVQYNEAAYGDREGMLTWDLPLRINENEGDDDIVITFK